MTAIHKDTDHDINTYPAMPTIDFEAYLPYLEDEDIPEKQKRELIEVLFNIMMGFADIAFGVSSSQAVCGKLFKIDCESHISAISVLKSKDQKTTKEDFANAAKERL